MLDTVDCDREFEAVERGVRADSRESLRQRIRGGVCGECFDGGTGGGGFQVGVGGRERAGIAGK